jgi:GcrA cell cycle regulator
MPARQPTWTPERVELLKDRFAAGLSCREIACDIGVSRNAVIGKISRLNLTREQERRRAARPDDARKRRPKSVPRLQYQMLRRLYAETEAPADDREIGGDNRCSLLELSKEKCRWPISSPGCEDFCFCGNPPLDGLPYCPGHTRLAYRPSSRPRLAEG